MAMICEQEHIFFLYFFSESNLDITCNLNVSALAAYTLLIVIMDLIWCLLTECLDGLYGNGCQGNCSTTCVVSGRCDSMTGQCIGGCQIGWKQPKCDASRNMKLLI